MTEPLRLRESAGAAGALMRGAELPVPHASRRRALAFTAAAANLAAGGTALAAGGVSLVKSVVLCVSLGVVGGGVASLGVSSAISGWDAPRSAAPAPRGTVRKNVGPLAAPVLPSASVAPRSVAEPPVTDPSPRPATPVFKGPPVVRNPRLAPSAASERRSLFDEQRVIETARAAIARGEASTGLKLLGDYERDFPRGQFHPEALALRVEALAGHGELTRARELAEEFARRYPQHPLLSRVQASAGRR